MALIYGKVERNAFIRLEEDIERYSLREQRRNESSDHHSQIVRNGGRLGFDPPAVDNARELLTAEMGMSGSGKSTSIKTASGDDTIEIGHPLESSKYVCHTLISESG
jgi:hypothetical protein